MPTTDSDYVHAVTRFNSTSVLATCTYLGTETARYRGDIWRTPFGYVSQWALSDVARVAMTFGNPHRRGVATVEDVARLCGKYNDMALDPEQGEVETIERMLGLQASMQADLYSTITRALGVLSQSQEGLTEVVPGWDVDLLGFKLDELTATGYLALAALLAKQAPVSRLEIEAACGWCSMPHTAFAAVMEEHLVRTPAEHKNADRWQSPGSLRRFQPSPLYSRPIVSDRDLYAAPAPILIAQKVSLRGLMYVADERWGSRRRRQFAADLGVIFERYAGSQLRLLGPDRMEPEQVYDGNKKTVDWVLEFEDMVLVVEVKLFPANQTIRMGGPDAAEVLNTKLSEALSQIGKSSELMDTRSDILPELSRSKRRVGMIVTLDGQPTTAVNFPSRPLPNPGIHWQLVSAEDLELLASLPPDRARSALLRSYSSPTAPHLKKAVSEETGSDVGYQNPVLETAILGFPLVFSLSKGSMR